MTHHQNERTDMAETDTTTAEAEHLADAATNETEPDTVAEGKGNREAARYRRQLRDVEAQRDHLQADLDAARRAAVEQLAGRRLHKPEALWAAGVDVNELVGADGRPDPQQVLAATDRVAQQLGLSRIPKPDRSAGSGADGSGGSAWQSAFRPRR